MTEIITLPRSVVEQALYALGWDGSESAEQEKHRVRLALRAALEQSQVQSGGIPPNWKLVPLEPADSQIRAAQDTWWNACNGEMYWEKIYAAMLAAAPQPPAVKDSLTAEQPQSVTDCHQSRPQGEQEPVAWVVPGFGFLFPDCEAAIRHIENIGSHDTPSPLYTRPQPKREPLTDELIDKIADGMPGGLDGFMKGWGWRQFARAVEAHGIGGEA